MAYDEELANRLREVIEGQDGVSERSMFGGLAFLINGNLAVSASSKGGLLLRVEPADTESLITDPDAERFVMRGREMQGWLRIDAQALETDDQLASWVRHGLSFARSLPPK